MADKQAYTVAEVAVLMGFSKSTVTRLFEHERGVLVIERPSVDSRKPENRKRRYRSIRIPRAVYERVVNRLSVK